MTVLDDQSRQEVEAFLAAHSTATLSTCGAEGPWAADVFYANLGLSLCFLSDPNTRHGRHIGSGNSVAATIHGEYWHWMEIRGVQMVGQCFPAQGRQAEEALDAFARKFPFLPELLGGQVSPDILAVKFSARMYILEPRWLRWLDNGRGFGFKAEVSL
jgi:hypothetical protein